MATVKINGKEITVEDNTLILDAARDAGYEIPTFCYQADLMGIGSCRMCLVEIEGQKKLQPACITPVMQGMSILTDTPTVASARAGVLEFLLANHAMDCPVCDKGGECELQDAVHKYGPHHGRHSEKKFKFHEKDYILSPVIIKNSNRCIQCMKCVRVCREVVGANVLGALNRGDHQEPTSFMRSFLDCDQDGNCIEVCPVGCFMRLPYRYKSRPWDLKGADTVCTYCATGCRMVVEERDGEVIRAKAQHGVGLNSETLCARGRFGFDFIGSKERVTTPLVRKFGRLEPATWEEAAQAVKDNMADIAGERIGAVASSRLTNEELYLFQKLVREVFGSPNIDSDTRWAKGAPLAFISATEMTGGGVSIFDAMAMDSVFVIGSHLSDENPVTDYIVRRISAGRRMNVITASPRAMKLDSSANTTVRHNPGAEKALLDAVSAALGGAPVSAALLNEAGCSVEDINAVVKRIKDSQSVAVIAGTEFLRYPQGASRLGVFTGALKAAGKKQMVVPVLDRCNQRGAWEMGAHPLLGPGYTKAPNEGMGYREMIDAAYGGALDAMYVIGEDILSSASDVEQMNAALTKLKFLVVQDMFLTETAKRAHVVLPAASFAEKSGTFTNQEGRCQSIKKLLTPPGKKSDIDIIAMVGNAFSPSFAPVGRVASAVFEEIRNKVPMYGEVSLAFVNKRNTDNKLDNKAALVKGSATTVAAPLVPEAMGGADAAHPFRLVTGNHLFHSGTLTMKSQTLTQLLKCAQVELSEDDARALGLRNGEKVKVGNLRYQAVLTVKTNAGTKKGVVFIAENYDEVPVSRFFAGNEAVAYVGISRA